MTKESSNDSSRHESGISPRRAARAARENAERERLVEQQSNGDPVAGQTAQSDGAPARHGNAEHHAAANSVESAKVAKTLTAADPAEETEAPDAAEKERVALADAESAAEAKRIHEVALERAKSREAAQRVRTQSALRARQEAIEAQRAAAERVRQTLRANAAPLRDRSASARGTAGTSATEASSLASKHESAQKSPKTPFDQDAGQQRPVAAEETPTTEPAPHDNRVAQVPHKPAVVHPPRPTSAPISPPAAAPSPTVEAQSSPSASGSESDSEHGEPIVADEVADDFTATQPSEDAPEDLDGLPLGEDIDGHLVSGTDEFEHSEDYQDPEPIYAAEPRDPEPEGPMRRENLFLTSGKSGREVRKARRRRRNWVVMAVLAGFCAVVFGVGLFLQGLLSKLNPEDYPAPGGEEIAFEVKPGWGQRQISRELETRDIVSNDKLFLESVQLVEAESREIHPGTYHLRLQMPALDAATILIGEPAEKVSYVAIKQNVRMSQVLEEIEKGTGIPVAELSALAKDPGAFGIKSEAKNLEGYLHPGEYRFPLDADAKTVLQSMVDATTKKLSENGVTEADKQYHVLKVASILQAEARKDDYGTVAGALENRLHPKNTETGGLLQVDSSVIYGLDRYTLQITKDEKVDAGNPYNTYVHKGLPPTPIGSPGDAAIKAAAKPTPNDYYYWVTVDIDSGETKFAKTYAEHQVNQNEFRAWCAANEDVC